jgi:two-component system, LytTR family, sensor kinase
MEAKLPIRKLFRIALYSSTAIGFITLAPIYITFIYIANVLAPQTIISFLKLSPFSPFMIGVLGTVFITFLIFTFWIINILYTYFLDKYSIRITPRTKYFSSYFFCLLAFFAFRMVAQFVVSLFFHPITSVKLSYIAAFNASSIEVMRIILISLFTLSANTLIFIIQNVMLLQQKEAMIESENAQLKIKNIEATYQQLKQQIHPHFLFNSLSTLKTLIKKQPEKAEIYLKKLSDFLRASISLDAKTVVKLDDELRFCMDYLDLQKVRFGDALEFVVNIPDEVKSDFVPVFSLQQLLENAIKHNALTKDEPLIIKVEYDHHRVIVSNNIREKDVSEESTGMGLANLAERYKILSGDEVIIQTDGSCFSVSLKILDDENSNYRG